MFRALADVHVAWTIFILFTPHERIHFGISDAVRMGSS